MKEINDIIVAYKIAKDKGQSCALATVVSVQGSSYRRPGARMLITDEGMLTGAISGGCLEGDALRKALLAIAEGKNKLVTYDTTDEDDAKFGVQLGCNGIVYILFEPIHAEAENNPLILLAKVAEQRRATVLSTEFSLSEKEKQPGTKFLYRATDFIDAHGRGDFWMEGARIALDTATSQKTEHKDGRYFIFHQYIPPTLSLIIAGAGNDALPLLALANILGWETTVVDGRRTHANTQRFTMAKKILVAKAENVLDEICIDDNTVCVLMTHNYNYDLTLLKDLLKTNAKYIGILWPKSKMQRMYDDLEKEGIMVIDRQNIFSPIGLDIGAETSEEIALSIVAEINAVMRYKTGQMLREKALPVHS